ncbi:methionine gamma-lyase [Sphingomicrobium clamense]|uniref:Methionine gamma-lyase n=1 Tax=Sphingomicrobium clamense TaxID=2851013 RepID=A0ABS6V7D9_9SPHN|nr:methionine gamma-lyase [Sphingomicrobium sp. B8]MBW0145484.1 methionine gamma-lyase [Sphingomicrobium sp. B8]
MATTLYDLLDRAAEPTAETAVPDRDFATLAIHAGYDPANEQGAINPPLHLSSTFTTADAEELGDRFAGEREGHIYSRISNPTVDLLEKRMAVLEGAEAALGMGSGMGAISAAFWTLLSPGDEIIADKTLYGCTYALLHDGLARFGIKVTHVDLTDAAALEAAISGQTRIVYFETPANPNMRVVDIAAIAKIAKASGALTIVDNTYATPYLTRPISFGADLVVHSASKYLGGHGDIVAGVVAGTAELIGEIRMKGLKDITGSVLSPFSAMLIMRGLKTLQLRMDRHSSSAGTLARWLAEHPAVEAVYYPGLESDPGHDVAKRQMAGFGGMIAFELKGGMQAGMDLIRGLDLIHCAVSLGNCETLIQHPASMTHSTYAPEDRAKHGISDGLVRISVGLEAPEDLIADLDRALA